MGTDITACVEYLDEGDYELFATVFMGCSYFLFARMAGVRNAKGVEPVSELRGFPMDAAWSTYVLREEEGGHSDSYLSADEFEKALHLAMYDADPDYEPGAVLPPTFAATLAMLKALPSARLVFWFDC